MYFLCLFSILLTLVTSYSQPSSNSIYQNGHQKYNHLLVSSKDSTSSIGDCWNQVLALLHTHCDNLNDNEQSFIAYKFTLCHLRHMHNNDETEICDKRDVDVCLKRLHLNLNAFIAYTEFFPFIQSVCYVMKEKNHQQEFDNRINTLLYETRNTINNLLTSVKKQQMISEQWIKNLKIQNSIMSNAIKLKNLVVTNTYKTQDLIEKIIHTAQHEYDLLKQICSLSQTIQTIVRISTTKTFWFYLISLLSVYLLTIPRRTNALRSILFCIIFLYVLIERYAMCETFSILTSEFFNIYYCRLTCWLSFVILLLYYAYSYQNPDYTNNQQLKRIAIQIQQTETTFNNLKDILHNNNDLSQLNTLSENEYDNSLSLRSKIKDRTRRVSYQIDTRQSKSISFSVQDYSNNRVIDKGYETDENKENENRYINLRHRHNIHNNILNTETPEQFENLIKHNEQKTRHYSLIIRQEQQNSRKFLLEKN